MKLLRGPIENRTAEDQIQGIKDLVHYLKDNKVGMATAVDLGVHRGASAHEWADHFETVHCVDNWDGLTDVYIIYLENRTDNMKTVRLSSVEAAKQFENQSLDFVYIDANHSGESVDQDIRAWFPKVKDGGAIGGHDYGRGDEGHFNFQPLTNAVDSLLGKPDKTFVDPSWVVLVDRKKKPVMLYPKLQARFQFGELCNTFNITTAVEIGTHQGVFADEFMQYFSGTLTCVDPWVGDPPDPATPVYLPFFMEHKLGREFDKQLAQLILDFKYPNRVSYIHNTSPEAATTLKDESVGFVYIDALHDYESVAKDIKSWWSKIYKGGVLAGHYYTLGQGLAGVVKAVDEFVVEHNLKLQLTQETGNPSWWVMKGQT